MKVGARIAVLAELDDDIDSISIPEESSAPSPSSKESSSPPTSPQEEIRSGIDASTSSESQAEAPPSSKGADTPPPSPNPEQSSRIAFRSKPTKQTYPLYPSVAQMMHEKGLAVSEADKIPASGPKGRLLKGDVLAYLGTIKSSYPSEESARISKLEHLDLSNIKIAPPSSVKSTVSAKEDSAKEEVDTEIAVSISLKAVKEVQERIHKVLGIDIPLENFVARAIEVSNMDLPRSKTSRPSADELFNEVLGLNKTSSKVSHGSYTPQIVALPSVPPHSMSVSLKNPDIIDILSGARSSGSGQMPRVLQPRQSAGVTSGSAINVFSVSASKGEEQRAKMFLERVKTVLQVDPGRLVL